MVGSCVLEKTEREQRVRPELRVAAYGVCVDGGRILLARYIGTAVPEWTLPGGGVEHGEDPYDAVIREAYEETGYHVEVVDLLGIDSARRRYPREAGWYADHHAIRVFYTVRVVGGQLRDEVDGSTDHAEWLPLDGLAEVAPVRSDLVGIGLALERARPRGGHH
jgi:ADP-ribose pyrophosphatase YjhB (NUDIX family)